MPYLHCLAYFITILPVMTASTGKAKSTRGGVFVFTLRNEKSLF